MVIDPYIIKQRPEPPVWAKLVAFFLILGAGFWFAREGINVYKLQNQDIYNGKIIFTSFQVTGSRLYYVFSNGNNILHEHSWVVITKLYNVGDIVKIYYDTNKKLSSRSSISKCFAFSIYIFSLFFFRDIGFG